MTDKLFYDGFEKVELLLKDHGIKNEEIGNVCCEIQKIVDSNFIPAAIILNNIELEKVMNKANKDVQAKKLQYDEILPRLGIWLYYPTRGKKIDSDEREYILRLFEVGMSISTLSRVFERSKASIHDIAHGIDHKQR